MHRQYDPLAMSRADEFDEVPEDLYSSDMDDDHTNASAHPMMPVSHQSHRHHSRATSREDNLTMPSADAYGEERNHLYTGQTYLPPVGPHTPLNFPNTPRSYGHHADDRAFAIDPNAHYQAEFAPQYNDTHSQSSTLYERNSYNDTSPTFHEHNLVNDTPPTLNEQHSNDDDRTPLTAHSMKDVRYDSGPKELPKRRKTVKQVELFKGNLVLDCPVPPALLRKAEYVGGQERDEFKHMRYTAATCDPSNFAEERYTLRQKLFACPRQTELFIVITMYNEEDKFFARTLHGVIKNIEYMNKRNTKIWNNEAWKKIVVCVVSDGRAKINPRTRAVLAALGVYQENIAKENVNGKDVTAHLYEYTTQMTVNVKKDVVEVVKGETPVQMLFCLKEKNQKKINSHRWFFQAFGQVLQPNICVLIDAGTSPGDRSVYNLWKVFDAEPRCGGACGEIKAMLNYGRDLINPLVAAQNFEYKMSNILDKPLESVFGFITVLPGAFSAYRYEALQDDKTGQGPLQKYFLGEKMESNAGIFTANMYLAEDRILCWELVSKRNSSWILQFVKSATAETDVPTEMADFIMQRRRWLNGSFFAAVYSLSHFYQIWRSSHGFVRIGVLIIEFLYQFISMLFAWFAIGNFFLVFRILTTSLGDDNLHFAPGTVLSVVFEFLYLAVLITCFVLALGNRPKGSNKFYMTQVYFWAIIMAYLMFATIFITVKSIQQQVSQNGFKWQDIFTNTLFQTLIVSMLSTYVLYFVASIIFFDPWHMLTSFLQYILLTPTYINILNVYAFCNTHDITWGTKGSDKAEKLDTVNLVVDDKVAVDMPADTDLNSQYETELDMFKFKFKEPKKEISAEEKHEDYYKGFRSAVVLSWIFSNLVLAAVVLNVGGLERIDVSANTTNDDTQRSTIYMRVVLYSVAALSAVRWVGCVVYQFKRLFRGV